MTPATADSRLKLVLRSVGGLELCALPFAFFPLGWMAAVHDRLGLGPMPAGQLVEYLARSLSIMYAVHGAVLVFVSGDTNRYRPLIGLLGWLHVTFGLGLVAVDVAVGWPWWWVVLEGPFEMAGGAAALWLSAKATGGRGRDGWRAGGVNPRVV